MKVPILKIEWLAEHAPEDIMRAVEIVIERSNAELEPEYFVQNGREQRDLSDPNLVETLKKLTVCAVRRPFR